MGQVTIYLDKQTERLMKVAVHSSGVSQSKWIADIIREKAGHEWPEEFIALAGAWADLLTVEEIRSASPQDTDRETW